MTKHAIDTTEKDLPTQKALDGEEVLTIEEIARLECLADEATASHAAEETKVQEPMGAERIHQELSDCYSLWTGTFGVAYKLRLSQLRLSQELSMANKVVTAKVSQALLDKIIDEKNEELRKAAARRMFALEYANIEKLERALAEVDFEIGMQDMEVGEYKTRVRILESMIPLVVK